MSTLDSTYTSPMYNSYFSHLSMDGFIAAQAVFYGGDQGYSGLTDEGKEAYIYSAITYANQQSWLGTRNAGIVAPSMAWPRTGLTYITGEAVSDTITPNAIGYFLACYILGIMSGRIGYGSSYAGGSNPVDLGAVKKKVVGGVTIEYETGGGGYAGGAVEASFDPAQECLNNNVPVAYGWRVPVAPGTIGTHGLQRMP